MTNTMNNKKAPYLATSAVLREESRELIVFAVNRSLEEEITLGMEAYGFDALTPVRHVELYSDDLKATNQKGHPCVTPTEKTPSTCPTLKKHSWNMLIYRY